MHTLHMRPNCLYTRDVRVCAALQIEALRKQVDAKGSATAGTGTAQHQELVKACAQAKEAASKVCGRVCAGECESV